MLEKSIINKCKKKGPYLKYIWHFNITTVFVVLVLFRLFVLFSVFVVYYSFYFNGEKKKSLKQSLCNDFQALYFFVKRNCVQYFIRNRTVFLPDSFLLAWSPRCLHPGFSPHNVTLAIKLKSRKQGSSPQSFSTCVFLYLQKFIVPGKS